MVCGIVLGSLSGLGTIWIPEASHLGSGTRRLQGLIPLPLVGLVIVLQTRQDFWQGVTSKTSSKPCCKLVTAKIQDSKDCIHMKKFKISLVFFIPGQSSFPTMPVPLAGPELGLSHLSVTPRTWRVCNEWLVEFPDDKGAIFTFSQWVSTTLTSSDHIPIMGIGQFPSGYKYTSLDKVLEQSLPHHERPKTHGLCAPHPGGRFLLNYSWGFWTRWWYNPALIGRPQTCLWQTLLQHLALCQDSVLLHGWGPPICGWMACMSKSLMSADCIPTGIQGHSDNTGFFKKVNILW